ncbi:MAG: 2,3-bisphosphoglycerate-independent phosphoglycerate mutase [Mycoplasmoidaceae bacterium]
MKNKKILLTILDGFGISEIKKGNAIKLANTPNLDLLMSGEYPFIKLKASGKSVGLPHRQIGNSEVGHLNIGAGRIVYTGLSKINNAIMNNEFKDLDAFKKLCKHANKYNKCVHIMGLLSPGGVHSHEKHIHEIIKLVSENGLKPILHIFGDGRDVSPKSISKSIVKIKEILKKYNGLIATISGRFYAMDRDKRWERVLLAYDNMIGKGNAKFNDILNYIEEQYNKDINDEFIEPAYKDKDDLLKNNDAILFANFRPDRARELCHLIYGSNYYDYELKGRLSNIFLATMTKYEGIEPSAILFPPDDIVMTFGEVINKAGLSQLRIAETEKYAHVTFFFDGGKELSYSNSKRILVDSPKVKTYDLTPSMSALEICNQLAPLIPNYDVIILNFANPDMVGHTGNFDKTVEAIEVIDTLIGRLKLVMETNNGTMFITADHGNAEYMIDAKNNIVTAHSTNDVPFISTEKEIEFMKKKGSLSNIAPTILDFMGLSIPSEMTSSSLLKKK